MSTTVTYKGSTLTSFTNTTKTLKTSGKYMEDDVAITESISLQSKTATPTESVQTISPDTGYYGLSSVEVGAISKTYVGSDIPRKTSSDLTASGATVSVPAGFYESSASKAVATATHAKPTASVNSSTGLVTASHTQTAGYVTAGTTTGTLQLTTQAAKTVTPTKSSQTAVDAGKYTTGAVTVAAIPDDYIIPSGSKTITTNGTHDVTEYEEAVIDVQTGGTYQSKTVSPSTSQQTVRPDTGYDALNSVTVNAMPSGTAGTPTASKGAVSNHAVDVTPSVTNTEGYIQGGTKTGTAVTVTASELVSGSETKTANGTYDVTNLASVIVDVDNSYTASDEGKVVDDGALVSQSSATYTANDTYDTTLINEVTVNVSGGGGSDTIKWKASRTAFPSWGGIYQGRNLELDFDSKNANLPSINYMAMEDGPDGKLTLKGVSSLSTSRTGMSDFLRQAPAFKEIDLGDVAPSGVTRWFYQWNYSANDKFATPPIKVTNFNLNNLSSQNSSLNASGTSNQYYHNFDVYFTGELKNDINLSGWTLLNADSWNRLIECLYDYSGGTAHTLTVGSTILNMIDSTHQALATSRGWTLA